MNKKYKTNKFEQCLKSFGGSAVAVCNNNKSFGYAVILPLRYKNKKYLGIELNDFGLLDDSTYIMLCSKSLVSDFMNETIITVFNNEYYLKSINPIILKGEVAYKWCIVSKCQKGDI